MKTDAYSKELLHVFFSQKKLITSITLFLLGVSVLVFLFWPREYQASGSLVLKEKTNQATLPKTPKEQHLQSELTFLHSQDFATQIIKKYYSDDYSVVNSSLQLYVKTALSQMTTRVIPKSNIIHLTLSGHDEKQNVKLLDIVMKEFIQYRKPLAPPVLLKSTIDTPQSYSEPLQELNANLARKRSLGEKRSKLNLSLTELKGFLNQLRSHVKKNKPQNIQIPDNPELNQLFDRATTLKFEQFKGYIKKLQVQESSINKEIKAIDTELQALDAQGKQLRRQQLLAKRIHLKSDIVQEPYLTFFKDTRKTFGKNNPLSALDMSVLEKPYQSAKPQFPFSMVIPIGLVSGLLLGTLLGFTRESLDHTLKRTIDIEKTSRIPVIFDLPEIQWTEVTLAQAPPVENLSSSHALAGIGLFPFLRRILDMALSMVLLIVTMPLFLFIGTIALLTGEGSVFQKELRLGKGKKSFLMLKFRSLVNDTNSKPSIKDTFGLFLQNTLLDELPQLINILLGDMTFVGPRPICPMVYKQHSRDIKTMDLRFLVKPGLIGPAQIYVPHTIPYRVRSLLDNRCATQKASIFSNLAFLLFVFFRLGKNLVLFFGEESMRVLFSFFSSSPAVERRRLVRRNQKNTVCRIMPREINLEEMFRMIGFHKQFRVVNINAESMLVKTTEPFSANEVTLRLKKQTARDGKPAKKRVVYLHGNMQYIPKYRGDNMSFYYVVSYRPISPLNDYKIHQHFLKESIIY